jgi:hypothetical protein
MSSDTMREEFEVWFKERFWHECYEDVKHHLFSAWQSSRESLVIELPPVRNEPSCDGASDGEVASWNIWVGDKLAKAECREAIESAGLKVKP